MLPADARLKKKTEFDRIFQAGRGVFGRLLGLKAADNGRKKSRYGIIVSAKVSKKAVIRNRIKRRLRAVVREYEADIAPGKDIAIIALPAAVLETYRALADELCYLLKKSGLIIKSGSSGRD